MKMKFKTTATTAAARAKPKRKAVLLKSDHLLGVPRFLPDERIREWIWALLDHGPRGRGPTADGEPQPPDRGVVEIVKETPDRVPTRAQAARHRRVYLPFLQGMRPWLTEGNLTYQAVDAGFRGHPLCMEVERDHDLPVIDATEWGLTRPVLLRWPEDLPNADVFLLRRHDPAHLYLVGRDHSAVPVIQHAVRAVVVPQRPLPPYPDPATDSDAVDRRVDELLQRWGGGSSDLLHCCSRPQMATDRLPADLFDD